MYYVSIYINNQRKTKIGTNGLDFSMPMSDALTMKTAIEKTIETIQREFFILPELIEIRIESESEIYN